MELSTAADCPIGETVTLVRADLPEGTRRRLAELGMRAGAAVEVLRRTAGGGRIVGVAGSRIALDADTARRLTVEPRWVDERLAPVATALVDAAPAETGTKEL